MTPSASDKDGRADVLRAAETLAARLPQALAPLARIAYNYRWSWTPGGEALFAGLDEERWRRAGHNPVRLLQEVDSRRLEAYASDQAVLQRMTSLEAILSGKDDDPAAQPLGGPVAFICAEFGVHRSLPFYAGGLGVLAGDFLKEASDRGVPMVGVGLFYSQGSFHQRLDTSGWQHEYWLETDSDRLPAALVTESDGRELTVGVAIRGREVRAQVWRVDVGRVPLYLLDANRPENSPADRWITARLYVGDREMRLAQYLLLGVGGVRALRAMGIEPSLVHLNEGHAALATLELLREGLSEGRTFDDALAGVRERVRFTTHTPVAAGNETFSSEAMGSGLPNLEADYGLDWGAFSRLCRVHPDDPAEPLGLTPLALRTSGAANGVSRLHGSVARRMWSQIWPGLPEEEVPIGHITNGVHVPTWTSPEMAELLERRVPGWPAGSWESVEEIPDEELWDARCRLRRRLAATVRERSVPERLGRGESIAYAESAPAAWSDEALTIGFARRIATYKRLYLIIQNVERGLRLLSAERPVQLVIAGRAHPQDEEAKRTVQAIFAANDIPGVGGRVVFLEEHDLGLSASLVQGCDLWVNLPRATQEASGTSGMKSVLNGGLQLSVLDGWWAEAWDGANGWAIDSDPGLPSPEQDARDAAAFFDLLEYEAVPLFYQRDERGIPREWVRRIKRSLRTNGPRFSATRMLRDYLAREGTA